MSNIEIKNMPEAKDLWKGIGGYFDSLGEIICEFVDNSISNFRCHNLPVRSIMIYVQDKNDKVFIRVEDSGTGIKNLDAAFTLGSKAAAETPLNEHGFGFKHALASANPDNDDWVIMTCTEEDSSRNQYKMIKAPYSLGGLSAEIIQSEWEGKLGRTGTIVEFSCTKEMFNTVRRGLKGRYTQFDSVLKLMIEELGFIYAGVLKNNGIHIAVTEIDSDGNREPAITVEPIEPMWERFYEPKTGEEYTDLGNGKVKIEYSFGSTKEHDKTKKYYKRNMASSGAEIRINGRILAYNIIRQIWGREPHPSYNSFLAMINIVSDKAERLPKTKTSKNGLREGDERLEKLFEWIRYKLPVLPKSSDLAPEDLDERDMFEQLKQAKKIHLLGNPTIETEMRAFQALGEKIRIDLFVATGNEVIVYKGKKEKSTVKDLYQLVMYWDGCVYDGIQPNQGVLIASSHPESVKKIVDLFNTREDANNRNYNIKLSSWKDEGINYPV